MKRINSLNDLLLEELSDLLNAEDQLIEALPKMAEAGESLTLKRALEAQLVVAKEHSKRLQNIFNNIGQNPQRSTCRTMQGLLQESEDLVHNTENGHARDIAIINLMQRVEQYEISGYITANEHAAHIGHARIVQLLSKTINEEREMKLHLSELAQGMINIQAIAPKSGGFYIPEGRFSRGGIKKKYKNMDVFRFISEGNPNIQEDSDKAKG